LFPNTHPWINTTIRRKINRKQKAHKEARKTKKKRDVDRYKRLQQEVQYEVRQANKKYMEDVSTDYKENSKKLLFRFSFVNTDWNCSFYISALLLLSLCRNPILFFNGATPVHS
jgi:hypothetical protein